MSNIKKKFFGQNIKKLSDLSKDQEYETPSESYDEFSAQLDNYAEEYRKQLAQKNLSTASLEIFASKILASNLRLLDEHRDALDEFSRQIEFFENIIPQLNADWAEKVATQISHARVQLAKAGGHARHALDPKQADKRRVRECWERWQKNQYEYRSKSAFARAMLDKYESLGSQRVIERWCKEWENVPSQ